MTTTKHETFSIVLSLEGDAFQGENDYEVARILRDLADGLDRGSMRRKTAESLEDSNGNVCGRAQFRLLTAKKRDDFVKNA